MDWLKLSREEATAAAVVLPSTQKATVPELSRAEFPAKEYGAWEYIDQGDGRFLARVYYPDGTVTVAEGTHQECTAWAREEMKKTKRVGG